MILAIRTDSPNSELYLLDKAGKELRKKIWKSGNQLSAQLLPSILKLLDKNSLEKLTGIIFYAGPGSFTGLRIGAATANAICFGSDIPAVSVSGKDWLNKGIKKVATAPRGVPVIPHYGNPPNITRPKK